MTRIALLEIGDGNFDTGFNLSLRIYSASSFSESPKIQSAKITGNLPPNPDVEDFYLFWQKNFRRFHGLRHHESIIVAQIFLFILAEALPIYSILKYILLLGSSRIDYSNNYNSHRNNDDDWGIDETIATNVSINEGLTACQAFVEMLEESIKNWLDDSSSNERQKKIGKIREKLGIEFNDKSDQIQMIIQSSNPFICQIYWYSWDLLRENRDIGVSFIKSESQQLKLSLNQKNQVRILAVFGDDRNIDYQPDWQEILKLEEKGTNIFPLFKPTAQEFITTLRDKQGWDILFFAGHSNQKKDKGIIYINEHESLTINQFQDALRDAREYGLQIAIFNSCKGLGLATQLSDLQIPFIIVMQDVVPDKVAQFFLKEFLTEYAGGKALPTAVRLAQSRLETFTYLPGATWLPVMFQSYIGIAPTWQDFLLPKKGDYIESPDKLSLEQYKHIALAPPKKPKLQKPKLRVVFLISLMVTIFLTGVRSLGLLEHSELLAYDHLMSQRPLELIDERILVVEITENDTNEYGYPIKQDAILAQAISELEKYHPRIIGLDLHRYQVREPGREDFIKHFKNKNIFTVCSYGSDMNYSPPSELIENNLTDQLGFSDLIGDNNKKYSNSYRPDLIVKQPDDENLVIRRQLLSYEPNLSAFPSNCSTPYSFSFRIAYRFIGQQGIIGYVNENEEFQFKSVIFKRLPSHFGGYQNLDGQSTQIMINYRSQSPGQRITLKQVLERKINNPLLVKNKIVLIGYTGENARDNFNTPYKMAKIPGVWIHAHQISQIISAVMEQRPQIWVLPQWRELQWGDILWILVYSILGGLLAWNLSKSPIYLGLAIIFMIWSLYQICLFSITKGLWLPLIPSLLSLLFTTAILTKLNLATTNQQLTFYKEEK